MRMARVIWRLVVWVVRFEVRIWTSLARWIARRPKTPGDGQAFGYRGPVTQVIVVFIALSVLEVVLMHLIVPWPIPRYTLLIVGIWGTLWMVGLLAALSVHPHVTAPGQLWVRYAATVDIRLPWDAIGEVRKRTGSRDGRGVQVDGDKLYVLVGNQYSVEVGLTRPVEVKLPHDRSAEVTSVYLHADDPGALVASIGEHLDSSSLRR